MQLYSCNQLNIVHLAIIKKLIFWAKRVDFFIFVLEDGAVEIQKYLFEMVKKEVK